MACVNLRAPAAFTLDAFGPNSGGAVTVGCKAFARKVGTGSRKENASRAKNEIGEAAKPIPSQAFSSAIESVG